MSNLWTSFSLDDYLVLMYHMSQCECFYGNQEGTQCSKCYPQTFRRKWKAFPLNLAFSVSTSSSSWMGPLAHFSDGSSTEPDHVYILISYGSRKFLKEIPKKSVLWENSWVSHHVHEWEGRWLFSRLLPEWPFTVNARLLLTEWVVAIRDLQRNTELLGVGRGKTQAGQI